MRVGVVILPEHRWPRAADVWRHAEDLGFDHAWTYDHLAWRNLRDSTWYAAMPTLTAAATATTRIRLGPLVASPNFRHPVPFAKEVAALDEVCAGRLSLGLGAGGTGWDATMLGGRPWSTGERAARFEEFVDLLDMLLREAETSYDGRFYSAVGARNVPGCVQRPRVPFVVAATGPRGMGLAARLAQTWVTTGDRSADGPVDVARGASMVSAQMQRLDAACVEAGRDPGSLDRMVVTGPVLDSALHSPGAFTDAVGRYAEAGVTDLVVHWPRAGEPFAGDLATFESCVGAVLPGGRAAASG